MNTVIITGRLGREPRHWNAGEPNERLNFSIAVDNGRGEKRTSSWLDVTMFGAGCSVVADNVQVGQELHVKGRLVPSNESGQTKPNADGQVYDRVLWQVIADSFEGVTFGRLPRGAQEQAPASNGNGSQASAEKAEEEVPF